MRRSAYRVVVAPSFLQDDHQPGFTISREDQWKEIMACFEPMRRGGRPLHVWLHGPPGSGKTLISSMVTDSFLPRVPAVLANCRILKTAYAILDFTCSELKIRKTDTRETGHRLKELEPHVDQHGVIAILDEIDQLPLKECNAILYYFLNLRNAGIIATAANTASLSAIEPAVFSRFTPHKVALPTYSSGELVRILEDRCRMALRPTSWGRATLHTIASNSNGDARIALRTLRAAGHLAEQDFSSFIEDHHVSRALVNLQDLRKLYALRNLSEQHRFLYDLIDSSGNITSRRLWKLYQNEAGRRGVQMMARRTVDQYLHQMVVWKLILRQKAPDRGKLYLYRIAPTPSSTDEARATSKGRQTSLGDRLHPEP